MSRGANEMLKLSKKLYAENAERMVYQLNDIEFHPSGIAYLHLDLVCGYDYVNPDENNLMGYVGKERFIDEVQNEMTSCDILKESIVDALKSDGYNILDTLPVNKP